MELSDVQLITAEASGLVYGLVLGDNEFTGTIAVFDLRDRLVGQSQTSSCTLTLADLQPCTIIHPQPQLSFNPTSMTVAPTGRYLAISGFDQEDEDQAVVSVVDLHAGQPCEPPGSPPPFRSPSQASPAQSPADSKGVVRHKRCALHVVDYSLFASRPGLFVTQLSWHPASDTHLAVLTSDSRLRLYCVTQLHQPQLTLHLQCTSAARSGTGSGRYGLSAGSSWEEATSISWGSTTGWGPLTLYVQSSAGAVYGVCPVALPGMRLSASVLQQALQDAEGAEGDDGSGSTHLDRLAWLQAAFGVNSVGDLGDERWWTVLPHVLDGSTPSLQGPLNAGCESLSSSAACTTSLAALHHLHLDQTSTPYLGLTLEHLPGMTCTTALVSGRSDGKLWLHLLLDQVSPRWTRGQPRAEYHSSGEVQSVRYECNLDGQSPAAGAALLLDAVDLPFMGQAPGQDVDECDLGEADSVFSLTLHPMSAAGNHLVVASSEQGSWVVGIPWLPLASQHIAAMHQQLASGDAAEVTQLQVLPPPVLHELLACPRGDAQGDAPSRLLSACCVQDVFLGRVVLLLQQPNLLHCVRPEPVVSAVLKDPAVSVSAAGQAQASTAAAGTSQGGSKSSSGSHKGVQQVVESAIQAVYGDLINPPVLPPLPASPGPVDAASPSGAAYLTSAIKSLRQGAVEQAHRAHQGLVHRAKQLDQEAAAQAASVDELSALSEEVAAKQKALDERVHKAVSLHANLLERAAILTQLMWSMPHPLSNAEQQLCGELDVMASRQAALAASWQDLRNRADQVAAGRPATQVQQQGSSNRRQGSMLSSMMSGTGNTLASLGSMLGLGIGRHGVGSATKAPQGRFGVVSGGIVQGTAGAGGAGGTPMRLPPSQIPAVHNALFDHMNTIHGCSVELAHMESLVKAWQEQAKCRSAEGEAGAA